MQQASNGRKEPRKSGYAPAAPPSPHHLTPREIRGMMRLYQAIVLQALQDVKSMRRNPEVNTIRREAITFFDATGSWGKWFDAVVMLAGWQPDNVLMRYRRFIAHAPIDYLALRVPTPAEEKKLLRLTAPPGTLIPPKGTGTCGKSRGHARNSEHEKTIIGIAPPGGIGIEQMAM